MRVSDKVMIPQDDHPEINFVGLLIGPRGNTLKNLEKDVSYRIVIIIDVTEFNKLCTESADISLFSTTCIFMAPA